MPAESPPKHPTQEQIALYLSGEGSEAFRAAVEQHLLSCEECMLAAQLGESKASSNSNQAPASNVGAMSSSRSTSSATTRKRSKRGVSAFGLVMTVLPPILTLGALYFYHEPLMKKLGMAPEHGTIILEQMPNDYEVLIDGQRAAFTRPTAASPAQITAEPGTYKLALTRNGQVIKEQTVTIEAGRDLRLSVDTPKPVEPPRGNDSPNNATAAQPTVPANAVVSDLPKPANLGNQINPEAILNQPAETQKNETPQKTDGMGEFVVNDDEIKRIVSKTIQALQVREPSQAKALLRSLYVDANSHRIDPAQTQFEFVKQLHALTVATERYIEFLQQATDQLQAAQPLQVGTKIVAVIEVTPRNLALRIDGKNQNFDRKSLPTNLEQTLVNTLLSPSPESSLIKSAGLLGHPELTASGLDQARVWMQEAVNGGVVTGESIILVDAIGQVRKGVDNRPQIASNFLNSAPAKPATMKAELQAEPLDAQPTHEFSRRLESSSSSLSRIFLLPPEMLIAKQTTLLGTQDNRGFGNMEITAWDIRTGTRSTASAIPGPLWAMQVSSNGKIMITYSQSGVRTTLRAYAPPNPQPFFQANDFSDAQTALALSADGRILAGCGLEENFVRWNLQKRDGPTRMMAQNPIGKDNVSYIAIRPAMDIVAVATRDGKLRLWHTSDGRDLGELSPSGDEDGADSSSFRISFLHFNRTGTRLLAVRENGVLELYDPTKQEFVQKVVGHKHPVIASAASFNDRFVVTMDFQHNVRTWDTSELNVVGSFREMHTGLPTGLAVDLAADFVGVAYEDSIVQLWKKK